MSPSPFLIALSGPTSSGKTTIATLLTQILPPSTITILHADDFYKPDTQIPLHPTGVQDWDCAAALDVDKFRKTLLDVRAGGEVPGDLVRQGGLGDGVHASLSGESGDFVERMKGEVEVWLPELLQGRRMVLVEGFLLFGQSVSESLGEVFDLRVLLRASREKAKMRREGRNGYVTLEGFWKDPEGYFDEVVWPGYVQEHETFFVGGDVEGMVKSDNKGVEVAPLGGEGVEELCKWVLGKIRRGIEMEEKEER